MGKLSFKVAPRRSKKDPMDELMSGMKKVNLDKTVDRKSKIVLSKDRLTKNEKNILEQNDYNLKDYNLRDTSTLRSLKFIASQLADADRADDKYFEDMDNEDEPAYSGQEPPEEPDYQKIYEEHEMDQELARGFEEYKMNEDMNEMMKRMKLKGGGYKKCRKCGKWKK